VSVALSTSANGYAAGRNTSPVCTTLLVRSITATSPAVYIAGDDGKPSVTDTTDASGAASRRLVVYTRALGDEQLLLGNKVDTAIVMARTWYKGVQVNGSPATFIVLIRVAQ